MSLALMHISSKETLLSATRVLNRERGSHKSRKTEPKMSFLATEVYFETSAGNHPSLGLALSLIGHDSPWKNVLKIVSPSFA